MTEQQTIDYLKTIGFSQYLGFEHILVDGSHSLVVDYGQLTFIDDNTGYEDSEDLSMFETTEEIYNWVHGCLDMVLDLEDEEE
jgi:hypothetical protein